MYRIIKEASYIEIIMKTLEIGDFCDSLLAHQISRSRGGSTNYHNFEVVMSINDFLMYLQQLYHDMKTYVISIDDKIKRNANAVNVHGGNDTFQFVVSEKPQNSPSL